MSTIGERLQEERKNLGLSQAQFGEAGGVQKRAQINYEAGERSPDAAYLERIAAIGADVQYVITGVRTTASLSADEQELLSLFRAAPLAVKAAAIGALQGGAVAAAARYEGSKQVFKGSVSGVAGRDVVKRSGKGEE
ncbi:MAG: helix-turn-helix transcriptional regulator [Proteobacteria bacterium]|nr:helix-turn-helix transcriptional regulator [Pseudomonadota bacterium]